MGDAMRSLIAATLVVGAISSPAVAQGQVETSTIRAGRNIAVTSCIACHVVSQRQSLPPVLGPGIPSFEEIANRSDTTVDSLRASMATARWHDYAFAEKLLPMSRISDTERAQVAAYILCLRARD